jgi:15-cis-phytoene synthase
VFQSKKKSDMMELYNDTCFECSKVITQKYSTSFSLGIKAFDKKYRNAVYAIYGFVRYADEIVDTFHQCDKQELIRQFKEETFSAIENKISLNPVLHSFQLVVNYYHISYELINAFLHSMEMDLDKTDYVRDSYNEYIYGSAEVIGLMCLKIFCEENEKLHDELVPTARSLGAAFQKINFLRDIQSDYEDRGRVYFPGIQFQNFTENNKKMIEEDIEKDFDHAFEGIKKLPRGSRLGVYIAYKYYLELFKKIKRTSASKVISERIRIPDAQKRILFIQAVVENKLIANGISFRI